ncbi:hypothetical protein PhaeoP75_00152 [Phaeobacter gallaeciensis]|uniref:Uncharacterized protein n=1 Tax=Phaeobacter gallaeciensis TaxID=60890 RepID=A0AAC9Z624_9RHOB|nr:hypothetical protein Gal_00153 [Phaeobacter gallaeciensis DSM 26640]ATE91222.1 hypothetical protein PhaeoP11_00152 [Phaeobacter gallaeciensis]ATE95497.1 hypothetical protein PhaeoP73_00152 [Phaeobacter gallaeciensis]ATE99836.1 hypothetical protein PhaeoP75_00152 [Phaeobacter gallaeciensis]ATF04269.1 hypothetical protein PhaeoP63_00152 [Phaeobacter gallaeciensis]
MRLVHQIAQAVISGLIAGRRNVEAFACGQLQARRTEMQFNAVFVAVPDPEHIELLAVQASKSQLLKGVHDFGLLGFSRGIFAGKADDARTVGPLIATSINQSLGAGRIAAQHFGQRIACDRHRLAIGIADQIAIGVVGQHLTRDEIAYGTSPRAFAVGKEFDQHCRASSRIRASCRSITTNWRVSASASKST